MSQTKKRHAEGLRARVKFGLKGALHKFFLLMMNNKIKWYDASNCGLGSLQDDYTITREYSF
jgi:hypothetical protein